MFFGGIQKTTLVDYPGKVACTLFLAGCNFRCAWCHNPELRDQKKDHPVIGEEEVLDFLEKRKGQLQGVCITGGEPTIAPGLKEFLVKVKSFGFLVKLDSNGWNPDFLEGLIKERLVDYIAMDIKNAFRRYRETAGWSDISSIQKSIQLVKTLEDYEFRTTVVPGLVSEKEIEEIVSFIAPAKRYYLQSYRSDKVDGFGYRKEDLLKKPDLEKLCQNIKNKFDTCEVRG